MALLHSPQIVTDGLVFYYDMANSQKSWKGKPTTNLTPDLSIGAIQAGPTVTYVGVENGWKKYSLNGTWSAGTYPYSIGISAITFTGGVTYSSGVYIKTNVPGKFASLFTGMNYVNQPMNNSGTSFSIAQSDGSIFVGRRDFQYTGTSAQTGYLISQPIVGQVFNGATDFVYIKDGQIEVGEYNTPFVAGTRSNTQAVVDLTGNNTVTANSLTYASDGSFSFNGSSNDVTISGPASNFFNNFSSQRITLDTWVNIPSSATWTNGFFGNILSRGNYEGSCGLWRTTTNNQVAAYFRQSGSTFAAIQSSATIQRDVWVNIVATWSGSTLILYINGTQASSNSGILGTPTVANWTIGNVTAAGGNSGNRFQGNNSAVKIYDRALSAGEVRQNFNALRGRYGL
jgi:hypothetical protein